MAEVSTTELLEKVVENLLIRLEFREKLYDSEKEDLKAQLLEVEDLIYKLS